MKFKKPLLGIGGALCTIALIASLTVSTFAAGTTDGMSSATPTTSTSAPANTTDKTARMRPELNDEQKAKMDATQEKWTQLTDAQKEEIYTLKDKAADIDTQIIDKYLEWGLIDQQTADDMKSNITDGKTKMREGSRMPMPFGGKGGKPGRGFAPGQKPGTDGPTGTSTATPPVI